MIKSLEIIMSKSHFIDQLSSKSGKALLDKDKRNKIIKSITCSILSRLLS